MFEINGYTLSYLVFSLFLALLPFVISYALIKMKRKGFLYLVLFAVWFLFFPNIPYLFTKGRYLIGYCGGTPWDLCGNSWMIGFFFLHALIGVPMMYLSIRWVANSLRMYAKSVNHYVLACIMLAFSSVALPVGLYGRFNSWGLLTEFNKVSMFIRSFFAQTPMEAFMWFLIFAVIYLSTHLFVMYVRKFAFPDS